MATLEEPTYLEEPTTGGAPSPPPQSSKSTSLQGRKPTSKRDSVEFPLPKNKEEAEDYNSKAELPNYIRGDISDQPSHTHGWDVMSGNHGFEQSTWPEGIIKHQHLLLLIMWP